MDQYDLQSAGMTSVAPPPAPMGRRRVPRRLSNPGRGIRMLSQLHPNHPIFQKYPGLAQMFARHAGGPQPPHTQEPVPGSPTMATPPHLTEPAPGTPTTGTESGQYIAGNYIPQTLEGYGGWGAAPSPQGQEDPMAIAEGHLRGMTGFGAGRRDFAARGRSPQGNIRDRLMQRYHTAGPQEPSLTSRAAMQHFLARQGRNRQARQPMLPLRQAAHRRPY